MIRLFVILAYTLVFNTVCKCYTYEDTKELLEHLFDTSRYNRFIRPVKNSSTITKVNISQTIRAISSFDVVTGLMCSYSFISMSWKDELLTWNSSDYGDITQVTLPSDILWNPQLEKTFAGACKDTDVEEKLPILNISLSNDGVVFVYQAKSIGAMCVIDMKMFPFDKHTCVHHFFTSKYTLNELEIQFIQQNVVDKTYYSENQEWSVDKSNVFVTDYKDTLSSLHISYATSLITVKRRPSFIMINNFAPAWLVSVLIIFAPFVPPDCERLSFSITTYLAMIFMNVSFVSEIPRNSIEIILFSQSLLAFNIISTMGIIWSIFIVSLSKISTKDRKVPGVFKKYLSKNIKKVKSEDHVNSIDEGDENEKSGEPKISDGFDSNVAGEIGWYDMACFLDKIYFVMSVLTVGVMNFVIFRDIDTG
ncbi:acetylcholine receptor subunit delta-like [Ruditapes philippinarum]|uniref:acetylcholine receptor subunit delta-like n=1 Tax=Ruditapes philippinarum TaxID=129788 RepID=UPI00295A912D|nr:acetylcholine receptor subunit delta-like [Ruditapes philippinarum]